MFIGVSFILLLYKLDKHGIENLLMLIHRLVELGFLHRSIPHFSNSHMKPRAPRMQGTMKVPIFHSTRHRKMKESQFTCVFLAGCCCCD
jgi:hypothetical protein